MNVHAQPYAFTLESFLSTLDTLETSEDIWQLFVRFIGERGMPICLYSFAVSPNARFTQPESVENGFMGTLKNMEQRVNAPAILLETYVTKRLYEIDPMDYLLEQGKRTPTFYHQDMLSPTDPFRSKLDKFSKAFAKNGITSGLYIPTLNPYHTLPGGVGVYTDLAFNTFKAMIEPMMADIIAAAHYLDQAYRHARAREKAKEADLSEQQLRILHMAVHGYGNESISIELGLSMPTISYHLTVLRQKLGANHNRELPAIAIRLGLVEIK